MSQVTFDTEFSGGNGDLFITSDENGTVLHFNQSDTGPKTLDLHMGHHILSVKGDAPNGNGGNIELKITGSIPATVKADFPKGFIPPHNLLLFVV